MSSTDVPTSTTAETQRPETRFLGREIVLTTVDQANYWRLLVEAFPTARLLIYPPHSHCTGPAPPELEIDNSFEDCPPHKTVEIIFGSDWTPRWRQFSPYK